MPGPDGHELPDRSLRRLGGCRANCPGCSNCDMGRPTLPSHGYSNCCSGTARRTCGTSRRRCTCSPSTRWSRPIPTRSSCGATVIRPRCSASVCSLIHYSRSWSSDRDDAAELGAEQLECWAEAVRRAMGFRDRVGDDRFADVSFGELQRDPVTTVSKAYDELGLHFSDDSLRAVQGWAGEHQPGARGAHVYELSDYGLTPDGVREQVRALPRHLRRDCLTLSTNDIRPSQAATPRRRRRVDDATARRCCSRRHRRSFGKPESTG